MASANFSMGRIRGGGICGLGFLRENRSFLEGELGLFLEGLEEWVLFVANSFRVVKRIILGMGSGTVMSFDDYFV